MRCLLSVDCYLLFMFSLFVFSVCNSFLVISCSLCVACVLLVAVCCLLRAVC